jgi:hypothetical protein
VKDNLDAELVQGMQDLCESHAAYYKGIVFGIGQVMILPAEISNVVCTIGSSGNYCVHKASNHRLVYGRITGFIVGLPLLKLHRHLHGNWSGQIHSEPPKDPPNVAVLIDIDCLMLPIVFDVHAKIEGDTPKVMLLESLLHVILDLPNQVLVSNNHLCYQRVWGTGQQSGFRLDKLFSLVPELSKNPMRSMWWAKPGSVPVNPCMLPGWA